MDVQNAIGKRVQERSTQQAHEPGQADERDVTCGELVDQGLLEALARGERTMIQGQRRNARRPRAFQSRRIRPVGNDHLNLRLEPPVVDGVNERLQVRSAPGYENGDPAASRRRV